MMSAIWSALIVLSVLTAAFNGNMQAVTQASLDSAAAAVNLALGLVGVMTFWLGMMKIVQDAGFLSVVTRALSPVMRRLFPHVPRDHPAMQAMIMNISCNMLGLGNAATPFGLRAMSELERINPRPGTASNAMILFLAINTSNVSLAPLGVIALRASLGSANAAAIWLPSLLATTLSTLAAVACAKLLERSYPEPIAPADEAAKSPSGSAEEIAPPAAEARPSSPLGRRLALAVAVLLGCGLAVTFARSSVPAGELARTVAGAWTLPLLMCAILMYGTAKGVDLYDAMVQGAKEGFQVAVRIIPFLVAIMVAVGMFRASGALDLLIAVLDPLTSRVGFPAAALPMALLRPLSGSGAFAILAETMKTYGTDSYVGYLVSTLQGSTETTFYILAVYFGSVGITRYRHAITAGLVADLAGIVGAVLAVRLLLMP